MNVTIYEGEPHQFNSINLLSTYYIWDPVLGAQEIQVIETDMGSFLLEIPCLVGKEDQTSLTSEREREWDYERQL